MSRMRGGHFTMTCTFYICEVSALNTCRAVKLHKIFNLKIYYLPQRRLYRW